MTRPSRTPRSTLAGLAAAGCLALCGCVVSGPGLDPGVDRETLTGAVARAPAAPSLSEEDLSDQRTVRNAVSAADLARVDAPVSWQNTETGATGTVSAITETRRTSGTCRAFTTTRQRFDGVGLYAGEACTRGEGEWVLVSFAEAGAGAAAGPALPPAGAPAALPAAGPDLQDPARRRMPHQPYPGRPEPSAAAASPGLAPNEPSAGGF